MLAQSMEDALQIPRRDEAEIERERRHLKAGTYTLAEKYKLNLEDAKRR